MPQLQQIISRIQSGELERDTDESYQNGFWDLSCDICKQFVEHENYDELITEVYGTLWVLYETMDTTIIRDKEGDVVGLGEKNIRDIGSWSKEFKIQYAKNEIKEWEKFLSDLDK